MQLTERDTEIIREVYRYRFLSSDQISALAVGGQKGILRRLGLLYHAGFLDRPPGQKALIGGRKMIYSLGNVGAEFLEQEFDMKMPSVDWTAKNKVRGVFLEHTIMVSQFMIALRLACLSSGGRVEFIAPEEIIEKRPYRPKGTDNLLSWKVEVDRKYTGQTKNITFSIIPDAVFGLRIMDEEGKKRSSYFFVEADRSTMPIQSANFYRSSFYKKMIGYFASWQQEAISQNYGFKNPRLLTLTISNERIKSMVEANKALDPRGIGLKFFNFAQENISDLSKPETVFQEVWTNGQGEKGSILQ